MTGLLRAELRKISSTKLWWALLVPIVALSGLVNLFGGLFTAGLSGTAPTGGPPPVLLGSLAYALSLTAVFSVLHGVVATAGEFRHRTITTTYLTAHGRGRVLAAKSVAAAATGALYAAVAVLVGVLGGLAGGAAAPDVGPLAAVTAIGIAVAALWGALGAALGTVISNLVPALIVVLTYLLVGELLISALLGSSDTAAVTLLPAYLPANAGDIALYSIPADLLAGPVDGARVVELMAGVVAPPPWWGALLVLVAWTAAAAATAWVAGGRRDIT